MQTNNVNFFEAGFDVIPDIINGDANSDLTGDRVSLQNWERAYLKLTKPAGTAGDDLSIALQQHTAASGGTSKALQFSKLWYKVGTMTAQGIWTAVELTTPTDDLDLVSVNGVDLQTDINPTVILVEVRADSLDGANGFEFVNVFYEGDDIGNALLITSEWIPMGNRYPQAIPLSSLA